MTASRALVVALAVSAAGACDSDGAAPTSTDGSSDRAKLGDVGPRDGLPVDSTNTADAGEEAKQAEFRALAENFCHAACDCTRPIPVVPPDSSCEIGVEGCCTAYSLLGYETCVRGQVYIFNELDRWCPQPDDPSCECKSLSLCKQYARTVECDAAHREVLAIPVECFLAGNAIPVEERCCTDPNFGRCPKPL